MAPEPSSQSKLARSAASAGAATMTSRILGLVRESVVAHQFGAGAATDAYYVAFRIPNLLRDLFAEGAMSAAFVPTFTKYLTTAGKGPAWRLGNHVVNALIVVTGVLVVLGMVFAEPLVIAFTSEKFAAIPGQVDLTVLLARIMLPTLTLIALAAAFMGMLNSLHHYFIPALSPAMFNIVTIVCVFALVPAMPLVGLPTIAVIAIGTLLGGVGQLALQWPMLRKEGFSYRPALDWKDEGLRRILVLMGPGTAGLAATQVNVFVNTLLATQAGESAISWLSYAFRLMYLPIGLFGVSIATAALPTVSRQHTVDDRQAIRDTVASSLSLMLMLNVPATVGLVVLAVPIVQAIYQRGEFTASDTLATAAALQFYAIGLLGYSVVRIISPVFYALGRNRTPVLVSITTVFINAGLNIVLVRTLGFRGLAFGTSIAALFNAIVLGALLRRHLKGLEEKRILKSLVRIVIAAAVMGAAAAGVARGLETIAPGDGLALQLGRLSATIGVALVVLSVASWMLRIREFSDGVAIVSRRIGRRPR